MDRAATQATMIHPDFFQSDAFQYIPADVFPTTHPVDWLHSHFAVGGWSPLQRLSGMLTAHMTHIAPHSGFMWHPHRGLEIYTWVLEGTLHHEDTTGGQGDIKAGELQRMFSGEWIEHQELNLNDDPVRVIQIWFMVDAQYRGMQPHYQQPDKALLPQRRVGDATVLSLIGDGSPMDQHIDARLTATVIDPGGETQLQPPLPDEDLFLYVTDGVGKVANEFGTERLGQYDVILARPDLNPTTLTANADSDLHFLSFYLPHFLR